MTICPQTVMHRVIKVTISKIMSSTAMSMHQVTTGQYLVSPSSHEVTKGQSDKNWPLGYDFIRLTSGDNYRCQFSLQTNYH